MKKNKKARLGGVIRVRWGGSMCN